MDRETNITIMKPKYDVDLNQLMTLRSAEKANGSCQHTSGETNKALILAFLAFKEYSFDSSLAEDPSSAEGVETPEIIRFMQQTPSNVLRYLWMLRKEELVGVYLYGTTYTWRIGPIPPYNTDKVCFSTGCNPIPACDRFGNTWLQYLFPY